MLPLVYVPLPVTVPPAEGLALAVTLYIRAKLAISATSVVTVKVYMVSVDTTVSPTVQLVKV